MQCCATCAHYRWDTVYIANTYRNIQVCKAFNKDIKYPETYGQTCYKYRHWRDGKS